MKFLTSLDLQQNELIKAAVQNLAGLDGVQGVSGQIAYNTLDDLLYIYDGSAWTAVGKEMTAARILELVKTVDGAGSGLDADLLDGNQASYFATADHIHSTYDNAATLTGANVYSNITVTDGIVTGLTSRALTASDVGAATSTHNHTLDSLSNVTVATNTVGEILKWNGTAWVNNTLSEAGIQPAGSYQPLDADLTSIAALAGTSGLLKKTAADTWVLDTTAYTTNTGTVTSVAALTIGTTGTDLSSTVATGTTTPVITLNVPTASATNRGALSSADWTTFNSKEPAIGTKNTAFNKNYGTLATDVKMNGAQAVGSVDAVARIDHVHPVDTSRAAKIHNLIDMTNHPVSGLTAGHYIRATGATSYEFAAIKDTDIPILNQNTTGSAGSVAKTLTFTGGNTGTFNGSANLTVAVPHTWAQAATKPTYTASEVGLGDVTNNKQIVATTGRTVGYIPTWDNINGASLANGYSVETTLTGASTAIPRADAVKTYVDGLIAASDAMVYKGTVGTGGTYTIAAFNALTVWNAGWTYKVIEAGTIRGKVCEIGDMLVATVDRTSAGVDADWTVIQTNVDGAVTGPASSTSGNFVSFNGATGKLIQDSTYNASSFALASHAHGDIASSGTIGTAAVAADSGDYILISDSSNSNKVQRAIAIGTGTSTFLRNDGTWNNIALGTDTTGNYIATIAAGTVGTQSGSSGLTITSAAGEGTAATIAHADTSTLSGAQGTAGIASITVDGMGHVTGVTTATYMRRYAATFGDGTNTTYNLSHGLGTSDLVVSLYEVATNALVYADIVASSTQVSITLNAAPGVNALRVVVIG